MSKMSCDRRRLLGGAFAMFGLGMSAPAAQAGAGPGGLLVPAVAERMAGLAVPRASARIVGRSYLETLPDAHRGVEALVSAICSGRCPVEEASRLGRGDLHARLRRWIADDFRARAVVSVEGWILSRTEARVAGLAAALEQDLLRSG